MRLRPSRRRFPRIGALALILVFAGCAHLEALGRMPPFPIDIERRPDAVVATSSQWTSDETFVALCPERPSSGDPDNFNPNRTLELSEDCVVYGRYPTVNGFDLDLGLGRIDATRRPAFDNASTWWLVLVAIDGGGPTGIYDIALDGGPITAEVTPGPSASPTPSASPAASPSPSPSPSAAAAAR